MTFDRYLSADGHKLICGEAGAILSSLTRQSIQMAVTSPPYWALRKYTESSDELGQEPTFKLYIDNLIRIMNQVWHVLKDDGTLWVNIGDTYYGSGKGSGGKTKKQLTNPGSYFNKGNKGAMLDNPEKFKRNELPKKSLCMIPARFAIAMQDNGWVLRNDVIWHKPNQFPTSAKDRFTHDYEHLFLFTKKTRGYKFNQQFEIYTSDPDWKVERTKDGNADWDKGTGQETHRARNMRPNKKGRNMRTVWSINTQPIYGINHFAKFPEKLITPAILAGSDEGDFVLDPFFGSGTTGIVCERLNRKWVGIDVNPEYCELAMKRVWANREE